MFLPLTSFNLNKCYMNIGLQRHELVQHVSELNNLDARAWHCAIHFYKSNGSCGTFLYISDFVDLVLNLLVQKCSEVSF